MHTLYDYFKDFQHFESSLLKIERDPIKTEVTIFFRIYIRQNETDEWKYLGVTFLRPEHVNTVIDDSTILYDSKEDSYFIKIHENTTIYPYGVLVKAVLTDYLRDKMKTIQLEENLSPNKSA